MRNHHLALISILSLLSPTTTLAIQCPSNEDPITSCSSQSQGIDSCCVTSPGGVVLFKQRFEPDKGDEGKWGIDGLDVLDCSSNPIPSHPPTSPRAYTHEQIGSFCAHSPTLGGGSSVAGAIERLEADWAESEVGEGLEEIWERAWRTAGRSISTLEPRCFEGYTVGQEVPLFFESIHQLHESLDAWKMLADSDITPSERVTYSRAEMIKALSSGTDYRPYLSCVNQTISTILWPVLTRGPFQQGQFVAAPDIEMGHVESCPSEGIHYPPIANMAPPAPSHTWDPITRPSPRALSPEAIERARRGGVVGADGAEGEGEDGSVASAPHAAHDKGVNVERLGFFKRADEKRVDGKDQEDGWGQRKGKMGDEL